MIGAAVTWLLANLVKLASAGLILLVVAWGCATKAFED